MRDPALPVRFLGENDSGPVHGPAYVRSSLVLEMVSFLKTSTSSYASAAFKPSIEVSCHSTSLSQSWRRLGTPSSNFKTHGRDQGTGALRRRTAAGTLEERQLGTRQTGEQITYPTSPKAAKILLQWMWRPILSLAAIGSSSRPEKQVGSSLWPTVRTVKQQAFGGQGGSLKPSQARRIYFGYFADSRLTNVVPGERNQRKLLANARMMVPTVTVPSSFSLAGGVSRVMPTQSISDINHERLFCYGRQSTLPGQNHARDVRVLRRM
ncbi:hypothetical protein C8R44DRAFT_927019 [Mycena epipterygia]|nr:hypothetical protein C8R44DRAFT_927019 [Mycena epipterygia]